jgi:hypothetical protein
MLKKSNSTGNALPLRMRKLQHGGTAPGRSLPPVPVEGLGEAVSQAAKIVGIRVRLS